MVIMWAFSMKRRLKNGNTYPNGVPDLPTPVRMLIRSYLALEELALGNSSSGCPGNVLWRTILEKNYEDRLKIVDYYWKILQKNASQGRTRTTITAEMIAGAPKMTGTDRELAFEHVAYELRKRGIEVDGEIRVQGRVKDTPPHYAYVKGLIDVHIQLQIDNNELNVRGETGKPPAKFNRSSSSDENVPDAASLAKRRETVRANDVARIAAHIIKEGCIPQAELGHGFVCYTRADFENLPKMSSDFNVSLPDLKDCLHGKGYTMDVVLHFHAHDDDGSPDDEAFHIFW